MSEHATTVKSSFQSTFVKIPVVVTDMFEFTSLTILPSSKFIHSGDNS